MTHLIGHVFLVLPEVDGNTSSSTSVRHVIFFFLWPALPSGSSLRSSACGYPSVRCRACMATTKKKIFHVTNSLCVCYIYYIIL